MAAASLSYQASVAGYFAKLSEPFGILPATHLLSSYSHHLNALSKVADGLVKDYSKPEFGLASTFVNGVEVSVAEEIELSLPFANLLHFRKVSESFLSQPKILLLAPMSGHYSTLLRPTVERLLPHAEVYISDWLSARDVSPDSGSFGLEDYADYVQTFIKHIGSDVHVIAICQSTVPAVMAVSRIAEDEMNFQPLSLTLMAGPLDPGAAPTQVTELADNMNFDDFLGQWITVAPNGRNIYPGYVQLASFISMNPESHLSSHRDLYRHYVTDVTNPDAARIEKFYREYFAVADLPAEFYADTVKRVFIDKELASGSMLYRERLVRPDLVSVPVIGIEGSKDDISAPGQTKNFLKNFENASVKFYEQDGAGHYGVFAGGLWRGEIAPRLLKEFHRVAAEQGIHYDVDESVVAAFDIEKLS